MSSVEGVTDGIPYGILCISRHRDKASVREIQIREANFYFFVDDVASSPPLRH